MVQNKTIQVNHIKIKLCITFVVVVILITLFTNQSSHAQSLNYSGGTCAGNSIDIYIIGGSNCSNPAVSGPSSWSVSPTPTSISYLNSNKTIRVTWNTAVSASVYVNYSCPSGGSSGTTSTLNLTISSPVTPAVSLSTNNPSICQGSGSIILTASPTNGGSTPTYNYYVDGASVYSGTSSSYTYSTSSLSAGSHSAYVVMGTSLTCVTSSTATSTTQNFNVTSKSSYSVSINGPSQICSSNPVASFFANVSGGVGTLSYQWYKNDSPISGGTAQALNSISVVQGDAIYCLVSSDYWCVNSPATSNTYAVNISSSTTPTVGIQLSKLNYCSGETMSLSVNSAYTTGSSTYSWKLNGTQFSTSSTTSLPVSTDTNAPNTFSPGDVVTVDVSNLSGTCLTSTSASGSTSGVPIVINAVVTPTVSLSLSTSNVCLPGSITFTANGTNTGTTPNYDFYVDGSLKSSQSGTSFTYSTLTSGAHSAYVIMTSAASCATSSTATSTTQNFSATDKTSYTVSISGPAQICSGNPVGTFYANVTGGVGNLSYQWYKNGSPIPGATSNPLSNYTVADGNTITCQVSSDYWCVNTPVSPTTPYAVSITTSTAPALGIQIPKLTFCSGESVTFTANSPNISGSSTFQWTLNGTVLAQTTSAITLTTSATTQTGFFYPGSTLSLTVNNLTGNCLTTTTATTSITTTNPNITIYPIPNVTASSQTICSGSSTSIALTNPNGVSGTTYSWTVGSITNLSGATSGSHPSTIAQTLTSVDGLTNGSAVYTITPVANGCSGSSINVTATVKPKPSITNTIAQLQPTICGGTALNFTPTATIAGTTYSWTSSVTGTITGISASGSGAITNTPVNTGNTNGTVTYVITPTYNSCAGQPANYVVTVKPVPIAVATPSSKSICSATSPNIALTDSRNIATTTYSWTASQTNVSGATATSGNAINQTLSTTTTSAGSANYTVTPAANSCNGTPIGVVITVNPIPSISGSSTTICSGTTLNFTPTSTVLNTSYTWTSAITAQISSSSVSTSGAGPITNAPVNNTNTTAGTVTYTITPTANACSGTPANYVVTVNPNPAAPAAPLVSPNTCDVKTLSKNGTAPSGVSWYWQGLSNSTFDYISGTATAPTYTTSINGTNTYYIRARSTAGCWSTSTGVSVTVDIPPTPNANSFAFCEVQPVSLTTTGYTTSLKWYSSTNQLLYTGVNYEPKNLNFGNYTYNVKTVGASGCESPSYAVVSLTVNEICDDFLNWSESLAYGINTDGTPKEVSASRTYTDGLGSAIQAQSRSYVAGQVFASENVYDLSGNQSLSTLSAPLNRNTFGYRHRFATNAAGDKYSASDFDATATINNPNSITSNGPGTLGWYYSASNTSEPFTAITNYPYSRSWSQDGPNPLQSKSVGPGDQYKMGSGHEVTSDKYKFNRSELSHYYSLQDFFFKASPMSAAPNLIASNANADNLAGYTPNLNVILSSVTTNGRTYVKAVCNQTNSTPGVYPIYGNITVTPGAVYKFAVQGYRDSGSPALIVKNVTANTNIVWPGATLPLSSANENWIESTFTVPAGCTTIRVGVLFNSPAKNQTFYINAVSLTQVVSQGDPVVGYKMISTDPDGKKMATFTDSDGKTLASALVTSVTGTAPNETFTYDYWSYTYYNDLGQVVGTVAPQGVVISAPAVDPQFKTTYKYDQLGRLIETTAPDEGTTKYVYSTDGKIRFSQNQEQRNATTKRFSYTNYDYLGRLIEAGEYTMSGTGFYVFEGHDVTTPSANSVLSIIDNTGYTGVTRKSDAVRCTDYSYIEYDVQAADFTAVGTRTAQKNLIGQVSKTENTSAKTWYSYDEFGQLEWSIQNITAGGLGIKTIDYTYDYLGNVTQVAYQAAQTDAFYHHYTYDNDQRLIRVETSFDGDTKTEQAEYKYYLHGPVKRVELAGNKQGVDYLYTISGALKSINHMDNDAAKDPGLDGVVGSPNATFAPDVWGETLLYHDNDYSGAAYNAGSVTLSGATYPNQFGGNVRAIGFNSPTDYTPLSTNKQKRLYGYQYDSRNQLSNAQFASISGSGTYTPTFGEEHREQIGGYDKNGNITSLVRKGNKSDRILGNYAYVYEANTNKLDKVNDNGSLLVDFTYNTIGQMTSKAEGGKTLNVSYNAYGLVKEVKEGTQTLLTYTYDDRGDLVLKTLYTAGAPSKNTFYVNDVSGNTVAIYDQPLPGGTISQLEVPVYGAGRVATYKKQVNTFFYEVNDHLGNVRAVIGQPLPKTYRASMESENVATEQPPFKYITERRTISSAANQTAGGNETIRLNNAAPAGTNIIIPVSPGDKIDIDVWAYYEAASNYNNIIDQTTMINAIATAFGGVSGGAGEAGQIWNNVQSGFNGTVGTSGSGTLPAAFLTYVLYDKNFNRITWGSTGVTAAGNTAKERLVQPQINIEQPGYIYVILYNRSNSASFVYFDELNIVHTQSTIVAGADYYPFGLVMDGREITDEAYRYGYQGQYSEENETTGWNEFQLRMYDARFGRWLSPDPYGQFPSPYVAMGNNPTIGTDPTGGECPECLAKFLADGGKVMDEVVVTASRIATPSLLGGITSSLSTSLSKSLSFMSGVGDSYKSSLTYGLIDETNPNTQANSESFSTGQTVGRYVALAHGVGEALWGGTIAAGGGTISLTGAGAVIGVPAVAVGGTMAVHGGSVAVYSWNNLNKVHNVNSSGKKPNERSKHPIGKRINFPTRKKAYEAAKRAGKGEPVLHNGEYGPHYHPGDGKGNPLNHDHYYFPKNQF